MPVHVLPFTSGTKITVRPSLRPRATSTSRSLATRRLVPTQLRVALDPAGHVARQAAAVDDRDDARRAAGSPSMRVAGEADDRLDRRVEIGEHLQRAVA